MTLEFLALLGVPYIYDISSLRVNSDWQLNRIYYQLNYVLLCMYM